MLKSIVHHNEPMAQYTSWQVGGVADVLFMPGDLQELADYLRTIPKEIPIFWCGLGSNILVRDGGIRGVVIAPQKLFNRIERVGEYGLRAEAGVSCATLARTAARLSLSGIEFLAGVPGTIGGALAMNAGCHDGETWPYVSAVELIDRQGNVSMLPASAFEYGYRHVVLPVDHWFVAAHFTLTSGDKAMSLKKIRTLLDYRSATQPTNEPSAGSTFRNPPGDYAGRLIEACGLKGYQIGGACVSTKHANFLINCGHASALDIEQLIYYVQAEVKRRQNVDLVLEVKIVGELSR
jgi:UDP-N-acetylmuramate dehydrogenase